MFSTNVSWNFRRKDQKNRSAKLQIMFSTFPWMSRKESNAENRLSDSPTKPPADCHPTNFTKRTQVIWNSPVRSWYKFRSFLSPMVKLEKENLRYLIKFCPYAKQTGNFCYVEPRICPAMFCYFKCSFKNRRIFRKKSQFKCFCESNFN